MINLTSGVFLRKSCLFIFDEASPFDLSKAIPISHELKAYMVARLPQSFNAVRSNHSCSMLLLQLGNGIGVHKEFTFKINPLFYGGFISAYTISLPSDQLRELEKLYPVSEEWAASENESED